MKDCLDLTEPVHVAGVLLVALSLSTLKDPLMSAHRDPEDLFAPPCDLGATMQLNFVAPYFFESEIGPRPPVIFTEFCRVL